MTKKLIVFTDSGDTIIDEATQIYDDRGIVLKADFIPGAGEVLKKLHDEGFTIALVVSEVVGRQKPAPIMFETAYEKLNLTEADKKRIVMIGNNLKKDIAGANRQGLTSIWLDWSPRYFHTVEEPDWQPDYTVKTPMELIPLLEELNAKLDD